MKKLNKFFNLSIILFLLAFFAPQFAWAEEAAPVTETPAPTETPVETPIETPVTIETPMVETPVVETPVTPAPEITPPVTETPAETPVIPTLETTPSIIEAPVETPAPIETPAVEPTPDSVRLTIRLNDAIIYSATTTISAETIQVTDNTGTSATIAQNTALGMLTATDATSDAFAITDLAFFASFNSYIINCLTISNTPSCYNWQYTVNDTYPFVGIDDYVLHNGDDVYLYFGTQNRFTVANKNISLGEPITVSAEKYEYRTNSWSARPNVTVGATQPNPADIWTPLITTSTLTNILGQASLLVTATGTYNIGIGDDYYYPTEAVVVTENSTTSTPTVNPTNTNIPSDTAGGNSNNLDTITVTFDLNKANTFLSTNQNTDGSIGSGSLYSDWAAIAVGSIGNASAKPGLITYLKTDPTAGITATDYERRAMALLALGLNPHTDTKTNYIAEIIKKFDGTQFGDAGLVNDDIFALFPLLKSGYSTNDTEIQKAVTFILSKQNTAGGWESTDLTAAAVQALAQVKSINGVNDSLARAKNYLKVSTKTDGRIGDNTFSTSWSLQALGAFGEPIATWNGANTNPLQYLATQQQADGGVNPTGDDTDSRIWATSYAILGAQSKTWDSILISVPKFAVINSIGNTVTENISVTTTIPLVTSTIKTVTSTENLTTSTTPMVTTTPEIIVPVIELPLISEQDILMSETQVLENSTTTVPVIKTIKATPKKTIIKAALTTANPDSNLSNEQSSISTPENPVEAQKKALFGGAAAMTSTVGAYLAWRFLQALI